MNGAEIAPGSILQKLFLKERIRKFDFEGKHFLDIGAGTGNISTLFLKSGMSGLGMDLNPSSCERNKLLNEKFVQTGLYEIRNEDYFQLPSESKFDLIFSSMVIEHLSDEDVARYFAKAKQLLKPAGRIVTIVPAGMKYWGIEDEIAGHYKRYSRSCFTKLAQTHELEIVNLSGLTYPISNFLLGISNTLVKKGESSKKETSMQERTINSSNRGVKYKTDFPTYFKWFLNDYTLLPLHIVQKRFAKSEKSMVLYCEMTH